MSTFGWRLLVTGIVALAGSMLPAEGLAQTVVKYVHTDALGSVVMMTDQNRNVLERREYEPYGEQLTPVVQNGPGYTGHVQDAATGLVYMQQRYYDPGIGRFLSVDPISADSRDGGGFNRYWYADSNPYNFTDPDGRSSCPTGTRICMSEKRLQVKIDGINSVTEKFSFDTESNAGKYFSRVANPLQRASGKEIGANLEQRTEDDLRVIDFHYDSGLMGNSGVSTLPYSGALLGKEFSIRTPG